MPSSDDSQKLYEQLASQCQRRQDVQQRDIYLILAADVALSAGRINEAERLRRQLLEVSPSTLIRPYRTFAEAMQAGDIRDYVDDLHRQYPPGTAARLLEQGSHANLLPADLFDAPDDKNEVQFPFGQATEPLFGEATRETPAERKKRGEAPALPTPAKPAAEVQPAAAPAKTRRRSPYEDPEFGPRLPANARPARDFAGVWIIHFLVGLVGLLSIGVLAHVFIRPFLAR